MAEAGVEGLDNSLSGRREAEGDSPDVTVGDNVVKGLWRGEGMNPDIILGNGYDGVLATKTPGVTVPRIVAPDSVEAAVDEVGGPDVIGLGDAAAVSSCIGDTLDSFWLAGGPDFNDPMPCRSMSLANFSRYWLSCPAESFSE